MTACGLTPDRSTQTSEEGQPSITAGKNTPAATPTIVDDQLRPIQVEDVQVEIGVGSPIPVEVHIRGTWPDPCAQLSRIEQSINNEQITIDLLASPADPNCPADVVSLPFGIVLPINIFGMAEGFYTVSVNGVGTSFEWQVAEPELVEEAQPVTYTLSFIGAEGNIWTTTPGSSEYKQITKDATGPDAGIDSEWIVTYLHPKISPDGQYIAVRRDEGQKAVDGYDYTFSLVVLDLGSGEAIQVADRMPAGYDWKPGTHLLAYAQAIPEGYFTSRGQVDASLAASILLYDPDTGISSELVKPEGSYAIYSPQWSPNARYLSFEEIAYMEGSGYFAYYDFDTLTYQGWRDAIGQYDWASDSNHILYDRMTYTATGEERIYLQPLSGGEEQVISMDTFDGYAFAPAASPAGDKIAYFVNTSDIDLQIYDLFIQDLSGGNPLVFGQFIAANSPVWSSDGKVLFFSSGEYRLQQVSMVSMDDGSITTIADGTFPTVATIER